jgi:hypothetical protein
MFELSLGSSNLWMCIGYAEFRNPFKWPCPRYRTCYGVDLTRRF